MRKGERSRKRAVISFRYHGPRDLGSSEAVTRRVHDYLRTIGAKDLEVNANQVVPHFICEGSVHGRHGESYFNLQVTRTTIPDAHPVYTGRIESFSPVMPNALDPLLTLLLTNLKNEGFSTVPSTQEYR